MIWKIPVWIGNAYRRHTFAAALVAGSFAVSPNVALSQAADDTSPDPIALVQDALAFLAGQETVALDWFVSYDTVIDGREKLTQTRNGTTLLDRSSGFYSYVEDGQDTREFFFDGSKFLILDVEENAYVESEFSDGFEMLVDRLKSEYDIALPIWSVLSAKAPDELANRAESAAYVGLTRIAGQPAHHLAFASYNDDWQVWVSADEDAPELLMLVGTDPYVQGWPQFRVYFANWDYAPEITDESFSYIPNDEASRMAWPKTIERRDLVGAAGTAEQGVEND